MEGLGIDGLRVIAAFCSGVLLCLSGSLIQGITQNELAGPSTLGFNAFGVIFILVGHALTIFFPIDFALEYFSFFLFLMMTFVLHFFFLRKTYKHFKFANKLTNNISFFILFGLCFNLFAGALFALLQFAFMTLNLQFPSQLWFGNFRFVEEKGLFILVPYSMILYFWGLRLAKHLRPLSFGLDFSAGLGVPIRQVQGQALLLALYAEGIVDSFYGVFSFVGLIFPHLLRTHSFFRTHLGREIVYGPLLCGVVMVILDSLCQQVLIYGAEIPVGMITSLIGSLFLMGILLKRKNFRSF